MRRALHLACVLVLLVAAVGPALASPQPSPTCRFCGGAFERAAEDAGANVTVVGSTADVQVHENGSATWTVRNELEDATAFREGPGELDAAARRLVDRGYGPPEDPTFVRARLDGDTVVLVYRDPDAAVRRVGVLVVDYFHDDGYRPWYHVNADRLTIHGPEGAVVTNHPAGVNVDGGTATWTGRADGELYQGPDLEGSPYVVFGPDRSTATQLRTAAAVASATAPIVADSARTYLLWQTAAFVLALAGVVALLRGRRLPLAARTTGAALLGLGALGTVVPVVVHGAGWLFGPPVFALGLGTLVVADAAVTDRLSTPRGGAAVGAALLAATYLVTALVGTLAGAWGDPLLGALRSTAFAFPVAAFLPLGAVVDDDSTRLLRWAALAVLGFVLVPPLVVNFVDPPAGFGSGLAAVFLAVVGVLTPVVGVLVVSLARSAADSSPHRT